LSLSDAIVDAKITKQGYLCVFLFREKAISLPRRNLAHLLRKKAKIIAAFLLLLFIGHVADSSLFTHIHLVDGRIITHAHPYSGTANSPHHQHSTAQIVMIAMMGVAMLAPVALAPLAALAPNCLSLFVSLREDFHQPFGTHHNNLRGPPPAVVLSF
jgi:hypothetical protein